MKRRGFTLIELVVVIALLALLSTMLVMAIGHMQTNGKRQQTAGIMQNLSAMFADYDVNRRVPFGAGDLNPNIISGLTSSIYLACPQDVSAAGAPNNDRTTNAVEYTRDFMAQLMSVPNTATAVGKLPSSMLMTFLGANLTASRGAWAAGNTYSVYDLVSFTDPVTGLTSVYIRTVLYTDPTGAILLDGTQQSPPNYYYWMPILVIPAGGTSALPTPVALDAWGNPIIFVMGGVLGAPAGSASGMLTAGGQTGFQVHSPDFHPFFASAGPDGNFSKGDDNLYSFEK